ncbi:hypothetical protein Egran_00972, partial [Elaphomyces granulatus]
PRDLPSLLWDRGSPVKETGKWPRAIVGEGGGNNISIRFFYSVSLSIPQMQLTSFTHVSARQHSEGGRPYPSSSDSFLCGICTGALASAAISSSRSLLELIPAAVHAVIIAFRAGLCASEVRSSIEDFSDHSPEWSIVVSGISTDAATKSLKEFADSKHLPLTSRPYISASSSSGVTISGPPRILEDLCRFKEISGHSIKKISIHAPYHAPHLFSGADVDHILRSTSPETWASYTANIPVVSSTTGSLLWAGNFRTLLKSALEEILLNPIHWEKITEGIASRFRYIEASDVEVIPVATSAGQYLRRALQHAIKTIHWPMDSVPEHLPNDRKYPLGRYDQAKIAIVGISGRFPSADNADAFWDLLYQGRDACTEVPPSRWDVKTHVDPSGKRKNTGKVRWGCWLENAAQFDARFFNMSPREAPQIDPAQRVALHTAYEALEQSGIVPGRTPSTREDRVGVFCGTASNDWCETNSSQNIDTYFIPGANRAFIPGRINYFFKFSGPSCSVDTACSSSICGIHIACNALWRGDIDTAIANGTNVLTNPDMTAGLARGHFLSETGNCKTFDDTADGYCRGEGVATVILKRLDDAIADNDPILGLILGAYTNHSAEAESITRPHVGAQKAIFERILNNAGTHPHDISYVEMHGTGTQRGDSREMQSVERNVHIALKPTPWHPTDGKPRRVFINNFSAAGGNSSLLIEDAPPEAELHHEPDPRTVHLVAITAKCPSSLRGNMNSMLEYLNGRRSNDFTVGRLSYTTTARRIHHPHRVILSGSTTEEIKTALEAAISRDEGAKRAIAVPKPVFTFTGQGSQYPGMGQQLFEQLSQFRSDLCRFDRLGQSLGFPSILPMFQATGGSNVEDYTPTVVQLANTCMQLALARLWIAWGIEPEAVVGHSLGEYAALNVAGVISDADTIYLVGRRAQLLQEKCNRGTHSMLAVLQSKDTITRLLAGKDYEIACINAPEETVLAGTSQCIQDVQKTLSSHRIKTMLLRVPFAFHSAQVTPILDSFRDVAKGVTFHPPKVPVVCPLLGNVVSQDGVFGPEYLARHSREPVNMLQALRSANQAGIITEKCAAIEFGPQPVVSKLVKATLGPKIRVLSTLRRNNDTWQILAEGLSTFYTAGAEIRWDEYHRDFHASHKVLGLPAYCWDLKPYWMQYVHDWSLFKGDPRVVAPAPAPTIVEIPKLESTTIHRIVEEKETDGKFRIVVEADITRPDLYPLVQGHKVEGVALCTPSVYADIAFTLGDYLLDRFKPPFAERIVDVYKMEIERALIAQEAGPQLLRVAAEVNWSAKEALLRFYSVDAKGRQTVQHSHCEIRFTDKTLFSAVRRDIPRVKARMDEMRENSRSGKTYRFNGQMAYNMVQSVAEFHPDYKCIDEAILDNETLEVACHVDCSRMKKGGTFHTHPGALDGLTQSGGFAMNANEKVKIDAELFVSHGWDGFQIFEKVTHERRTNALPETGVAKVNKAEPGKPHTRPAASTPAPASVKASAPSREVATPAKQAPVATLSHKQVLQAAPAAPMSMAPAPTGNRGTASDSAASQALTFALKILAEESGVDQAELGDDVAFADIGVDSLLSLVIGSRFRDELSLDLEPENLFTQCPTVKELKALFKAELEASSVAVNGEVPTPSAIKAIAVNQEYTPEEQDAAQQTIAHDSIPLSQASPVPELQVDAEPVVASPLVSADSGPGSASFASVLQIIAEESGVAVQDLGDDVVLADIGVDSLLALVIGSRIRDEMSVDLDVETMLVAFPTVKDLKSRFGDGHSLDSLHEMNSSSSSLGSTFDKVDMNSDVFTPKSEASESGILVSAADSNVPPTTSVVLQGLPKSARQTIFLFPDGCGSATSYAGIPRVSSDTAVVGLNSPYLKNPHEMTSSIDDLINSYLNEVRRRQPSGPYHFGGWSVGGILAYRAGQRLLNQGEHVHSLILIDSPAPNHLAKLPQHFYDYCDTVGLFGQGTGKAPEWLVPHFMASNNLMSRYYAAPLPHGKAPKTTIIWAGESGVPDYVPRPGDPEDVKFLTVSRTDFSVGPWGRLFPGSEVNVETAVGANHFSMMSFFTNENF